MSLLQNSNAIPQLGGYNLTDSVRFRGSQYLSRTPSSTGSQTTFTLSAWIKRCNLGSSGIILSQNTSNSALLSINNTDELAWDFSISSGRIIQRTNAKLRDPSAWYHIVWAIDTTQATDTDRFKVYINSELQSMYVALNTTGGGNYFTQNQTLGINTTNQHDIGRRGGVDNDAYFGGYLTEVNFIDGQQLTPSDFGEYDATTGVWKPKKYTGTYGTNGFYLPMNQETELYSAEYLIVAGGGGGAWGNGGVGGGGGAGGLLAGSTDVYAGTVYNITVGTGGAGSASAYGNNAKGTNSTALGLTAIGGGNGRWNTTYVTGNGSGGSGGGAGAGGAATPIGTGTAGQGNNGGNQSTSSADNGGGGGGKGSVGGNAVANTSAGNGGTGYASSITGTSLYYAGGGGGGGQSAGGTGGSGVGGNGGKQSVSNATSPTANTGSGGGGGMGATAGADGVVILRVLTSNYSGTTTGSPTVTTDGSYTVMKFTSNGSYTA